MRRESATTHKHGRLRVLMLAGLLSLCAAASRADEGAGGYADLVGRVLPSVVNISVRKAVPAAGGSETRDSGGVVVGSGFIIDPAGYVVTNRHVVVDSYSITVGLSDGTRLVAHVVGHPPATDIALLKVDPDHPLPAVQFGDSEKIRVGERVLAIGNPLGLGGTVTAGIVSALNRDTADTPYDNYIQTDAAINHGNSGGPLFNMRGEVIGVTSAIFSPTAGSAGLGMVLPADDAKFAVTELREFGRVRPGWIGARLQQVTPDLSDAFGVTTTRGALVAAIQKSSPAEAAGLRVGDIISKFADRTPTDVRSLMRMIAESPLNSETILTVHRGDSDMKVPITVREYPPAMMVADFPFELSKPPTESGDLGLRLQPLGASTRARLQLPADTQGVEVASVPPGSAADRAGLRTGDVVLQVLGSVVATPSDVQKGLQGAHGRGRAESGLLIVDSSGQRWVALSTSAEQAR
ncbi:MAG: trypsin-like peptidase domain-containing protein [Solirubrobacterales bacterium]|nr:trypsin-like peptidase domain-containing protein [Solirubrobacterales bacterium]